MNIVKDGKTFLKYLSKYWYPIRLNFKSISGDPPMQDSSYDATQNNVSNVIFLNINDNVRSKLPALTLIAEQHDI